MEGFRGTHYYTDGQKKQTNIYTTTFVIDACFSEFLSLLLFMKIKYGGLNKLHAHDFSTETGCS